MIEVSRKCTSDAVILVCSFSTGKPSYVGGSCIRKKRVHESGGPANELLVRSAKMQIGGRRIGKLQYMQLQRASAECGRINHSSVMLTSGNVPMAVPVPQDCSFPHSRVPAAVMWYRMKIGRSLTAVAGIPAYGRDGSRVAVSLQLKCAHIVNRIWCVLSELALLASMLSLGFACKRRVSFHALPISDSFSNAPRQKLP